MTHLYGANAETPSRSRSSSVTDVVVVFHVLEPADHRKVSGELPSRVHGGNTVFRPHVHDRAVIRAVADALTIGPGIIAAVSEFRIFVHLDVDFSEDRRRARHRLDDGRVETEVLVSVGEIARGGNKERQYAAFGVLGRTKKTIYSSPGPCRRRRASAFRKLRCANRPAL